MKTKKKKIVVSIVGHDSWSGPERLYTEEFNTLTAAEKFCAKFNSNSWKNVPYSPEYYETAEIEHNYKTPSK